MEEPRVKSAKDRPRTDSSHGDPGSTRFGATLRRVLFIQAVALALLWLLQAVYHRG